MKRGKINLDSYRPQLVYIDANDYIECQNNWRINFLEGLKKYSHIYDLVEPALFYLYKKYLHIKVSDLTLLSNELSSFNIKVVFIGKEVSVLQMVAKEQIQGLVFLDVIHMPMSEISASVANKSSLTFVSKNNATENQGFMHPEEILWKKKVY